MSSSRRAYDPHFKDEAIKLVVNTARSVPQVAEEIGVPRSTLGKWVREYRSGVEGEGPLSMAERAELKRLRKEKEEWDLDRAFLKKASIFFAQEAAATNKRRSN